MMPPRNAMSRAGAQRHEDVGERARAAVVRIDVDHGRAARLRLHHPLEGDRMRLGHVRALEHDQVGVLQVAGHRGRRAAAERRAEADDGRAVADARLVLDLDHAERREELLDQVVLLVVERRAAERGDAHAAAGALPVVLPLPALVAVGDARGRRPCPSPCRGSSRSHSRAVRPPVEHVALARRPGRELQRRRALRAEPAAAVRRVGIALDLHDLVVAHVDVLRAADRAVGAHRPDDAVGGRGARARAPPWRATRRRRRGRAGRGRAAAAAPASHVRPRALAPAPWRELP